MRGKSVVSYETICEAWASLGVGDFPLALSRLRKLGDVSRARGVFADGLVPVARIIAWAKAAYPKLADAFAARLEAGDR